MSAPNYIDHARRARQLQTDEFWRVMGLLGCALRRAGAVLSAWSQGLREARERRRAVAELLGLDRRSLRDLGLDRAGVHFAVDHGREDLPASANVNRTPAARSAA